VRRRLEKELLNSFVPSHTLSSPYSYCNNMKDVSESIKNFIQKVTHSTTRMKILMIAQRTYIGRHGYIEYVKGNIPSNNYSTLGCLY
jgi:hypothetical protein